MTEGTSIPVSEDTRDMIIAMAEAEGIPAEQVVDNLLQRLVELDRRSRFPLNEKPGDYTNLWGRPIIKYRMGTLYVCEHGHALLMTPTGHPVFLSDGSSPMHRCEFKPRP